MPQYERQGKPLPRWAQEEPPQVRGDEFWLRAFWELSSCRQFGSCIGPIPWDRTILYADRAGLGKGLTELFVRIIRELDEAYLETQLEEQRTRRSKGSNKKKVRKR